MFICDLLFLSLLENSLALVHHFRRDNIVDTFCGIHIVLLFCFALDILLNRACLLLAFRTPPYFTRSRRVI